MESNVVLKPRHWYRISASITWLPEGDWEMQKFLLSLPTGNWEGTAYFSGSSYYNELELAILRRLS